MTVASLILIAMSVTMPVAKSSSASTAEKERALHVRTLDSRVREWIRIGHSESKTFAELLDRLERSDLIVYITVADRIPGGVAGQVTFVTSKPPVRYLRVELADEGTPAERIALLGHELQHAVEIANAPMVVDSQTMASFYLLAGALHMGGSHYDSIAARAAGDRVRAEVSAFRSAAHAAGDHSPNESRDQ